MNREAENFVGVGSKPLENVERIIQILNKHPACQKKSFEFQDSNKHEVLLGHDEFELSLAKIRFNFLHRFSLANV